MSSRTENSVSPQSLIDGLRRPQAYPHTVDGPVIVHETHVSIVFLAGDYAYKLKKTIKTDFLDYSTLDLRKHYCHEELRLDGRYADDLYLEVVPVTAADDAVAIQGGGVVIDYAVKMRRFPENALLSNRVNAGLVNAADLAILAETVATFHETAEIGRHDIARRWPDFLKSNLRQMVGTLRHDAPADITATLDVLSAWSETALSTHLPRVAERVGGGFVRECHGDLHLANVVCWHDRLVPFDGIEFSQQLRWIDLMCDAAFVAMDLAAHGRADLSRSFMNAYLQHTGDYGDLGLLRLFLFYRALVRALTASMGPDTSGVRNHLDLADRFTLQEPQQLWITHGVSGSGKTTRSEGIVQSLGAIRIRSDVERKRVFGLSPTDRGSTMLNTQMYSDAANQQTQTRLHELASGIVQAGYSVIIDATFLRHSDRQSIHDLARQLGVRFVILDCDSDTPTLRQRIAERSARGTDASDADLAVLERQLNNREPLTSAERACVVETSEGVPADVPSF